MNKITVVMTCITMIFLTACSSSTGLIGEDSSGNNMVKVIDINLTEEAYGIGVDKEHPEILSSINSALADMKSDGTLDAIIKDYEENEEHEPVISAKRDFSKEQLVVATTGDFAPFDYEIGQDSYGIDKEVIKEIADRMGKELVLVDVNFDIMFMTVAEHKADACIAGITINEERKKYVDFSDPYYIDGLQLVVNAKDADFDNCKTKEDVDKVLASKTKDFKVAVEAKTTAEEYANQFENNITISPSPDQEECIEKLIINSADAVIGDAGVLKYTILQKKVK